MRDSSRTRSAPQLIDQRIRELGDWRGSVLKRMRELIHEADPEVVEEWKWAKASSAGTPAWSHDGGICTGESYKQVVKLTFFRGASLKDPAHLFNSGLVGLRETRKQLLQTGAALGLLLSVGAALVALVFAFAFRW